MLLLHNQADLGCKCVNGRCNPTRESPPRLFCVSIQTTVCLQTHQYVCPARTRPSQLTPGTQAAAAGQGCSA